MSIAVVWSATEFDGTFGSVGSDAYFWSATEFDGTFSLVGYNAGFWSAAGIGGSSAWFRSLDYGNAGVYRSYSYRYYGFSVRCARD